MNFDLNLKDLLTIAGTFLLGIVSTLGAWMMARPKAKADVQTTINAGFTTLISELQEETSQLRKLVREQAALIMTLETEIRKCNQHNSRLQELLEQAGIVPLTTKRPDNTEES